MNNKINLSYKIQIKFPQNKINKLKKINKNLLFKIRKIKKIKIKYK